MLRLQADRRNQETETILKQSLESVLLLDLYPRSQIDVIIHVVESDGYDLNFY